MPVNLIIRNPLDWDALAIARNANGANRRELSDYVRFLKAKGVWNDLGFFRDFANAKSLNHSFGPNITFTRASAATYFNAGGTLQTVGDNAPRFDHDPATGASRGLLIEESRTNLLQRSAEFDDAYWTKMESSIDANAIASPDGTTTADKLKTNTNAAFHSVVSPSNLSVTSGIAYTASVFAKKAEKDILFISWSSAGFTAITPSFYDLTNGTATAGADVTASMIDLGNGWYRCIATKTATVTTASHAQRIGLTESTASASSTGANSTDGLYIWGAQLEAGAFPTSYIPTTTAAATRAGDSAVVTPISNFYNQAEGTLFAEFVPQTRTLIGSGSFPRTAVSFDNDSGQNYVGLGVGTGTDGTADSVCWVGVITNLEWDISGGSSVIGTNMRAAGGYAANDAQAAINGTLGTADTTVTLGTQTHMRVGSRFTADRGTLAGHIRKIAYWPRRLTNTLLEEITT
jgi:hypothetical protein